VLIKNVKRLAATEALYDISFVFCGSVIFVPSRRMEGEIPVPSLPITMHRDGVHWYDDNRLMGKNVFPVKTSFPIWLKFNQTIKSDEKTF